MCIFWFYVQRFSSVNLEEHFADERKMRAQKYNELSEVTHQINVRTGLRILGSVLSTTQSSLLLLLKMMIVFVLDKSKRTIVLFSFILQANVYSKQSQSLAVNSLFPAHRMLLCYEDACINFSIRKSNKTILIIKDVAIVVPKAIPMIWFFLFLQRGLGGTHRSLVAWTGSKTSASAFQSKLFSDFTACGSSNKALWKRSCNRICLFGNCKVFRAEVYFPAMWLPETGLETAHNAGFFKFFFSFFPQNPLQSLALFLSYLVCRLFTQCKSGGWAHVIPTPGFRMRKRCVTSCPCGFDQSSSL